eukprot:TRINITY_DN10304_c0_g1_i1.p1 TRINITY_DN10304_c0_g1~~TRINITY_DN10304_c0_g1_i1.p1  ORF type:complete len:214 (+),score=54.22 TRINITY_DN10304_c0_g1_i1:66-707(+)
MLSFVFGKKPTPEETVKKWRRELRKEGYAIERQIRAIEREIAKITREIRIAAKTNINSARNMAKEIIRSRKAIERLHESKAHLNSVSLQLQQNLSTYKLAGCLKKSTEIMASMNRLIKLPELQATMMAMSREMEKSGLIEEMVHDIMSDDEEIEDEAEEEVDKIMDELNLNLISVAPNVRHNKNLKEKEPAPVEVEEDQEFTDMKARLNALRE